MADSKLTKLVEERKWFDLTEYIQAQLQTQIDNTQIQLLLHLYSTYLQRIHPISSCKTSVEFSKRLEPEKAIFLLGETITQISSLEQIKFSQQIHFLKMNQCLILCKLRQFENIETQLFIWKNTKLSDENFNFLSYLSAIFYESIGNIEKAQKYHLEHAKGVGHAVDIEKLIKLSLLSPVFYDFSSISSLKDFKDYKNASIKSLFMDFQEGNINQMTESLICQTLNIESAGYIKEKLYLMKIISICFASETRQIPFSVLQDALSVDKISTIKLILKALGLGVLHGWINANEQILNFNKVIPRSLNKSELGKIKSKFVEWQTRVENVINAIEEEYK